MIETIQTYFEYTSDKFGQTLDDGGSWFEFILDYLAARLSMFLHMFMSFVLSVFGEVGKEAVYTGDVVSSSFAKNGFTNFNNFFYAVIGLLFLVFAVKYGIKLLLKILDLIGNYIPFT